MIKIPSNIELVIFDCDGTLVDSEYINSKATSEVLIGLGHKKFTAEYCLEHFTGCSANDIMLELSELKVHDPHKILHMAHMKAVEIAKTQLKAMPNAIEVVKEIKIPKCIASNGQRFVVLSSLKTVGLDKYFNERNIYTAELVPNPKPAPDLYFYSAKNMGKFDPAKCLVVEDSVVGVTAGKAAGMNVIGFVGTQSHNNNMKNRLMNAGAFSTIENLSEILQFML